jgi:hypothetical protein
MLLQRCGSCWIWIIRMYTHIRTIQIHTYTASNKPLILPLICPPPTCTCMCNTDHHTYALGKVCQFCLRMLTGHVHTYIHVCIHIYIHTRINCVAFTRPSYPSYNLLRLHIHAYTHVQNETRRMNQKSLPNLVSILCVYVRMNKSYVCVYT